MAGSYSIDHIEGAGTPEYERTMELVASMRRVLALFLAEVDNALREVRKCDHLLPSQAKLERACLQLPVVLLLAQHYSQLSLCCAELCAWRNLQRRKG